MKAAQDKRPFPFDFSQSQLEVMISLQERNVQRAKTPEEKEKAEQLLAMQREQARWRFVRELPHLFRLYQRDDGCWEADLSSELHAKANSLRANAHTDKDAEAVVKAIFALSFMGAFPPVSALPEIPELRYWNGEEMNGEEIYEAAQRLKIVTNEAWCLYVSLSEVLIPRLHAFIHRPPETNRHLAKKLKKDLAHAIDHLVMPGGNPRSNSSCVLVDDDHGNKMPVLVQVLAIEAARQLAEEHQELPTKAAVRQILEANYPTTAKFSENTWVAIWKEAGLSALPRKRAFS